MASKPEYERFKKLSFKDFKRMAQDSALSKYEKIGFPDSYRKGKEDAIFQDILRKLPQLRLQNKIVVDIGPGCSDLPLMLIKLCRDNRHSLVLIDSEEMLSNLPDEPFIKKVPAQYPHCEEVFHQYGGKANVILAYSVLHYVFEEANMWQFLDRSLELMTVGGELLIGDVPNISKRKRFFSSPSGIKYHQEFTGTQEIPEVVSNRVERDQIDDAVVLSVLARARNEGFDAYVLPQSDDLPMANRREDILIRRP